MSPAPQQDRWSNPVTFIESLTSIEELSPQGATLLPNGDILCYGNGTTKGAYFIFTPTDPLTRHALFGDSIVVRPYQPPMIARRYRGVGARRGSAHSCRSGGYIG